MSSVSAVGADLVGAIFELAARFWVFGDPPAVVPGVEAEIQDKPGVWVGVEVA